MFTQIMPRQAFLPTALDGCVLWLDADDESTITESSGDISQWDDKSPAGNDVTQGTLADQPDTGVDTQNSRNVTTWTGGTATGDRMIKTSMSETVEHIFAVLSVDATPDSTSGLCSNGGDRGNIRINGTSAEWRPDNGTNSGDGNDFCSGGAQADFTVDLQPVATFTFDQYQMIHADRGPSISDPSNVYTNLSVGGDPVGGGRFMSMKLAELIMYNRTLTNGEINRVQGYLKNKWAV